MKPHQTSSAGAAYESALDTFKRGTDFIAKEAETLFDIKTNIDASSKTMDGESMGTIVLPLPNIFSDQRSHAWSMETGIVDNIGSSIMSVSPGGMVGNALENFGGKIGKLTSSVVGNTLGRITVDKIIATAASSAGLRKPLIDPGYFQNYSGTEPVAFGMVFDLMPNNVTEANSIIMIIMKLKQYSSPSKMVGGVSLLAPYFFNIEISNPYISTMAKFGRVVLKNISIEYGADGSMQHFGDGVPKQISLSLSWQCVDMTTMEDFSSIPMVK